MTNFLVNSSSRRSRRFRCRGVAFDGSTDYGTRGAELTGVSDAKVGTVSYWIDLDTDGAAYLILANGTAAAGTFRISKSGTNKFEIYGYDNVPAQKLYVGTGAIALAASGWQHVLASWDLGNNKAHIYVTNVDREDSETIVDANIDYDSAANNWAVGAGTGGNNKVDANLAELWFDDSYLDISTSANRQKFITLGNKPADLGSDGSLPTGSQPLIYLSCRLGDAASVFFTNKGTGGNFTDQGSIALSATSPSD